MPQIILKWLLEHMQMNILMNIYGIGVPAKALLPLYQYIPVSCVSMMPYVCCTSYIAETHFSPFRKVIADHDVFSHVIPVASVLLVG
jgi:hypothetical protein